MPVGSRHAARTTSCSRRAPSIATSTSTACSSGNSRTPSRSARRWRKWREPQAHAGERHGKPGGFSPGNPRAPRRSQRRGARGDPRRRGSRGNMVPPRERPAGERRVRVWQPGGHLTQQRGAEVDDWSWRRTRRRLATLARLTAPYKVRTILSVFSLLAATATALAPPFLSKYAVDDGIRRHDLQALWWIVGAFLFAGLANWGMSYVQTYLTGWVGERILADLRNKLFGHLQRLSLGFFERTRAGVIISRLTNDVEALDQLVTDGVSSLVQNSLTLIGTAIVLFLLDWKLALATLTILPPLTAATIIFRVRSTRAYRAVRERLGLVTATLAEDIAGMRVVQAFTREPTKLRKFHEVNDH